MSGKMFLNPGVVATLLLLVGCADSGVPFSARSLAGDRECISAMAEDGQTLVMACDGAAGTDASIKIVGIDPVSGQAQVREASFASFNAIAPSLISKGMRLVDHSMPLSQNLQPDQIRFPADTGMARISLGANGAEALVSLEDAVIEQLAVRSPATPHWPQPE